jgi:hypothetical protein
MKILAILVAGLFSAGAAVAQQKSINVPIHAQNKSGESGSAKLTPEGDKTKVEISLKGASKAGSQPAHIHDGPCAKLDPKPRYGLSNVENGKSTTEVPVKIEELTGGNLAINVHKSAADLKTYVACGDIKKASAKKK